MRTTLLFAWSSGLVAAVVIGSATGSTPAALVCVVAALAGAAVPLGDKSLYTWVLLYARRNRPIRFGDLVDISIDGNRAGIRCASGVAVAAVRILGKAHQPTRLSGATPPETSNTLDLCWLIPALKQTLGITLDSISVVMAGSRRSTHGDYPRVYDSLLGAAPYAGLRETWLLLRVPDLLNGEALQCRPSLGSATASCARRTAAMLRQRGVRARVATASEISEFERRVGREGLEGRNRCWDGLRSDTGWLTTFAYRTSEFDSERLGQAWLWQADGVIQNVTIVPGGTATATVTVRSSQRLASAPSASLRTLHGEQAQAAALNMCVARQHLTATGRVPLPVSLVLPVGPSGVLIGKYRSGGRMLLPLTDAGEESRVHIAAEDDIAHRVVMRLAATGEPMTVHTGDITRWKRLRMPNLVVTEGTRPIDGTTTSVLDGTLPPTPRPRTIISIGAPHEHAPSAEVLLEQIGPQTLRITTAGVSAEIDVEMFRVEKSYLPAVRTESH